MEVQACFHCYNLFAGHMGDQCPTKKLPALLVPYRPLTQEDIGLAKHIHTRSPDNSIPYELILKENMIIQDPPCHVAAFQAKEPLTQIS